MKKEINQTPKWTWNETKDSHDGVFIGKGKLEWFTYFANPRAGGGGVSQDFASFFLSGPHVPQVPQSIVNDIRSYLLTHHISHKERKKILKHKGTEKQLVFRGNPIKNFTFDLGNDSEYEFDVTFYPDIIRWYLEFDEQWLDQPREALQTIEDFLENGPPSDFSMLQNDESLISYAKQILAKRKED